MVEYTVYGLVWVCFNPPSQLVFKPVINLHSQLTVSLSWYWFKPQKTGSRPLPCRISSFRKSHSSTREGRTGDKLDYESFRLTISTWNLKSINFLAKRIRYLTPLANISSQSKPTSASWPKGEPFRFSTYMKLIQFSLLSEASETSTTVRLTWKTISLAHYEKPLFCKKISSIRNS
jgi:hypothetical protein